MKIPLILIFASTLILVSCTQDTGVSVKTPSSGVDQVAAPTTTVVSIATVSSETQSFTGTLRSPK